MNAAVESREHESPVQNPTGLQGIEFVEFASPDPDRLHRLFLAFGFSRLMRHEGGATDLYRQNGIVFLLNRAKSGFSAGFASAHGPSISSMGWRFAGHWDGLRGEALRAAVARGAEEAISKDFPELGAIRGIGDSLIYFCPPPVGGGQPPASGARARAAETADWSDLYRRLGFRELASPDLVPDKGFLAIDHLTNNVPQGEMARWSRFYREVFGFTEVRYFDIRGAKTGLQSYALRSPDGSFCIPINEGTEAKSQINEYLEEYRGPGIQHLAFLTRDILGSLRALEGSGIETLDIEDDYYREVFERVPGVTEDREEIRKRQVLVDGDPDGYLLQIFTKNLVGPIFVEIIQRKNHQSFGEGNFGALFRSIERDQVKRGYLRDKA